jgi:hypothetical protein
LTPNASTTTNTGNHCSAEDSSGPTPCRNQQRTGGSSHQERIDETRNNGSNIVASLSEMARSVSTMPYPPSAHARQMNDDVIGNLQRIQDSSMIIAQNLGATQEREMNERLHGAWNAVLDQFMVQNNLQPQLLDDSTESD